MKRSMLRFYLHLPISVQFKRWSMEIAFDFIDHRLDFVCSDGARQAVQLRPVSVAVFYREVMAALAKLGVTPRIWTTPCEVEAPVRFEDDLIHKSYDAEAAHRFWRALAQADRVMKVFRGRFIGKASPVHFFWGSFDLAATRFSGRRAPPHPGSEMLPASVSRGAYSHEVSSCGFWPGGPGIAASFYAYAYPEPAGFPAAPVRPGAARYDTGLGEFVLPYEIVRTAADPDRVLLDFLQSTYEAAANLAAWPRLELERPQGDLR